MRFPHKAERVSSVTLSHKVVAPRQLDMMSYNECNNNNNAGIPVGFRFHPTDEELVGFYLLGRITTPPPDPREEDLRIIRELDLYRHEPWDLSEVCKIPGDHSANQNNWYFFSHKDKKYPTGNRANRATKAGFWKATGRDKCIQTRGAVGMRKTLVFYRGRAPHGQKTDWIMHEFRLDTVTHVSVSVNIDTTFPLTVPAHQPASHHHASSTRHHPADHEAAGAWVVCRVFRKTKNPKSKGDNNRNTNNNNNNDDTPTTSVEEDHQMALLPEITDSTEKFSSDEGEHVDYPPVVDDDMHHHFNYCKQELLSVTTADYAHHDQLLAQQQQQQQQQPQPAHHVTSSSGTCSMFPPRTTANGPPNTYHSTGPFQLDPAGLFEHPMMPSTSSAAGFFSPLPNNPYLAMLEDNILPRYRSCSSNSNSNSHHSIINGHVTPPAASSSSAAMLDIGLEDFRFGLDQTLTDVVTLRPQLQLHHGGPAELELSSSTVVPFASMPWLPRSVADFCHHSEVNNTTFLDHQH